MQLFVYGVLIRELATGRAAQLVAPLGAGVPGTVRGSLHAVPGRDGGWYPIMLPDPAGPPVYGVVHDASGVDWPGMDAFEDAHDGPEAEYRRRAVGVSLPEGASTLAQAYCYARDVPPDAEPIASGSFAQWLAETGRRPIGMR